MAYVAKLNSSKKVVRVHAVRNEACPNDTEEECITYLNKVYSVNNVIWKKCSYNTKEGVHTKGKTPYRGNYPGVGWEYDPANDIFIRKQPFPSWTKNVALAKWEAPVPMPAEEYLNTEEDLSLCQWDEPNQRWIGYKGSLAEEGQAKTDTPPYRWEPSNNTWILI